MPPVARAGHGQSHAQSRYRQKDVRNGQHETAAEHEALQWTSRTSPVRGQPNAHQKSSPKRRLCAQEGDRNEDSRTSPIRFVIALDEEEPAQQQSREAEGEACHKPLAHLPQLPAVGSPLRMRSIVNQKRPQVKGESRPYSSAPVFLPEDSASAPPTTRHRSGTGAYTREPMKGWTGSMTDAN